MIAASPAWTRRTCHPGDVQVARSTPRPSPRRGGVGARRLVALAALLLGTSLLLLGAALPAAGQAAGTVLVAGIEGPITPVIASHVEDAIAEAEARGHLALVLEMDTPGGLDTAMREIVQDLLAAEVPVITFVSPPGARAASAGSVIALGSHVIAMAPGTNIGAATPIDLQGGEVLDKVVNDAAAYVEAVAEARGRDPGFFVDTVRDGRSAAASEVVELGAADLVVDNLDDLLEALDGREVTLAGGTEVTLATATAGTEAFEMSALRRLLQAIADPNLAFLLISVGSLAVIYEVASPGGGFAGAVGGIMLIIAFFSLSVLPVNLAGLLLVALAVALFIAEAFAPGIGAFAGGGALALLFAGLLLFQRPTGIGVDLTWLIPIVVIVGALAGVVGVIAVRTRKQAETTGTAGTLVGAVGTVRSGGADAQVMVNGALWRARSTTELRAGQEIRVIAQDGLTLDVLPTELAGAEQQPQLG